LLLLGHGENSLFAIDQELRSKYNFPRTKMILADVADPAAMRSVFSMYRPRIVFHAAAHKHVPIVEENICEAARNNVLGTRTVALAAAASGTAKFVLLSTDKAVNPTSVMGLTKRMAELICQSFAGGSSTEFVVVRFGNVLGSRGSVVPTFKQQVASGGPVTITHRDMMRYFMTIPEAVSLVLQAMSMGNDGEVFVLDMGDPIKILHLAEQVIRLSGFEPYRDIEIVETNIRPGEKLFEEILTDKEDYSRTSHQRLFIAKQDRVDYARIGIAMERLQRAVRMSDWRVALDVLREFVPEFTPGAHLLPPAAAVAVERNEIAASTNTETTEILTTRITKPAPAQ
jgi:FlaA1/EpsC-like NDP-sugar epimerase